jgi:hypothetical protein
MKAYGLIIVNPNAYNPDARFGRKGMLARLSEWVDLGYPEDIRADAFETMDWLCKHHNITIITARTEKAIAKFKEKYPDYANLIKKKDEIIANGESCDILVDDHPEIELIELAKKTIIINHDYNEHLYPGLPRIERLDGIKKYLKEGDVKCSFF